MPAKLYHLFMINTYMNRYIITPQFVAARSSKVFVKKLRKNLKLMKRLDLIFSSYDIESDDLIAALEKAKTKSSEYTNKFHYGATEIVNIEENELKEADFLERLNYLL